MRLKLHDYLNPVAWSYSFNHIPPFLQKLFVLGYTRQISQTHVLVSAFVLSWAVCLKTIQMHKYINYTNVQINEINYKK